MSQDQAEDLNPYSDDEENQQKDKKDQKTYVDYLLVDIIC